MTHVQIMSVQEKVITVSQDKDIHVFDLNTQTCIQSIYRKFVPLGPRPISAMYFNPQRTAMLLANNQLCLFERKVGELVDGVVEELRGTLWFRGIKGNFVVLGDEADILVLWK